METQTAIEHVNQAEPDQQLVGSTYFHHTLYHPLYYANNPLSLSNPHCFETTQMFEDETEMVEGLSEHGEERGDDSDMVMPSSHI